MDDRHFTYITKLKKKKTTFSCFVKLAKTQRGYELCLTSLTKSLSITTSLLVKIPG
jgi:hypothetical protein